MTFRERFYHSDFYRVFNFKSKPALVRSLMLINTPMGNIANALTSGALYTAFLAENGIDIVRVGIISFIPYLTWLLSFFSPLILSRFRMRQKVLLFNDTVCYVCVVLATTIMPIFVEDPGQKTLWFAILLFIGNLCNALLGSGCASWMARFVPEGKDLNTYTAYSNLLMLISANGTGILAALAASWLSGSPYQMTLLFWLRILAFVLFAGGSAMLYLIPKDEPLAETEVQVRLTDIVTQPCRHRPFLLTCLITVFWSVVCNINGSTYSYYLLETAGIPLWFQYIGAVTGAVSGIFLSGPFRCLTNRTSPYWVVALFILVQFLMEIGFAFVDQNTVSLYVCLTVLGGFVGVGFSLGYNSLFYLKLPKGANKDLYATFWNLVTSVAAFVGAASGTFLLSRFERRGMVPLFGREMYGSQVLCFIKALCMLLTFVYLLSVMPGLTRGLKE